MSLAALKQRTLSANVVVILIPLIIRICWIVTNSSDAAICQEHYRRFITECHIFIPRFPLITASKDDFEPSWMSMAIFHSVIRRNLTFHYVSVHCARTSVLEG